MKFQENIINSYLIPILAAVLIIVVGIVISVLLVEINWLNFILAALLFIIIGVAIFLANVYQIRLNRLHSVDERYELLRSVFFSGAYSSNNTSHTNVLSFDDVLKLEQNASEVWIYAYNLHWEMDDNPLTEMVYENFQRGVKYLYIVPDNREVRARVQALYNRYSKIRRYKSLIEFRARPANLKLVPFGVVIYNPTINKGVDKSNECVVVFFPHFDSIQTYEDSQVFLSITGRQTQELEVQFKALWDELQTNKL